MISSENLLRTNNPLFSRALRSHSKKDLTSLRGFYQDDFPKPQLKNLNLTVSALEKLRLNSFDVALIDYELLNLNDVNLLLQLEKTSPKTVTIVLTDSADEVAYGADVILEKPVKPQTLLNIIDEKQKMKH